MGAEWEAASYVIKKLSKRAEDTEKVIVDAKGEILTKIGNSQTAVINKISALKQSFIDGEMPYGIPANPVIKMATGAANTYNPGSNYASSASVSYSPTGGLGGASDTDLWIWTNDSMDLTTMRFYIRYPDPTYIYRTASDQDSLLTAPVGVVIVEKTYSHDGFSISEMESKAPPSLINDGNIVQTIYQNSFTLNFSANDYNLHVFRFFTKSNGGLYTKSSIAMYLQRTYNVYNSPPLYVYASVRER